MKNPFAFLFASSTSTAGRNAPPTSVNLEMPPVKPARQPWEDDWDRIAEEWPVGTTMTWIGAKMHVVGIQRARRGYYPRGLLSIPPQAAGFRMEYADKNGVVREYFMPAQVAVAYFKQ
jgi:hypothetical protein